MKYIIMADGDGKRWNNYTGVPKHLIEINGETLLGRTTRLLKENNVDYIITSRDERYKKYGTTIPQTNRDCEIDRFEDIGEEEICYLYGDVYYTEEALKTIINTQTDEILFFGSEMEIFGIKIVNKSLFMEHKNRVKELFLNKEIDRCIGWEVYKSLNNLPLNDYAITDRFYLIDDGTDDIDTPANYLDFINKYKGGENMIKCEVIENFTLQDFDKLVDIERKSVDTRGKLYVGDTFKCNKELADYLLGANDKNKAVVKVIEVEPEKDNNTIEMEVSFDSDRAINKVREVAQNGGTYEEAIEEVGKIIDDTIKVKPKPVKKKKSSKK